MGRNRLPTNVHEMRGSYKKNPNRRPKDEPAAEDSGPIGDPPGYFDEGQTRCWNEIVRKCHDGVLTEADSIAVEMAAVLLAQFRDDPVDFKAAKIVRLDSLLARFGMTPSDRTKVKVPTKPKANSFSHLVKPKKTG